jgi:hypothetical protein
MAVSQGSSKESLESEDRERGGSQNTHPPPGTEGHQNPGCSKATARRTVGGWASSSGPGSPEHERPRPGRHRPLQGNRGASSLSSPLPASAPAFLTLSQMEPVWLLLGDPSVLPATPPHACLPTPHSELLSNPGASLPRDLFPELSASVPWFTSGWSFWV